MTRAAKLAPLRRETQMVITIKLLRAALVHALHADSPLAVGAIRHALKRAEDAQILMRHCRHRTEETTP